jgi:predicted Zn-ribbon and HTH transcriptional regulator
MSNHLKGCNCQRCRSGMHTAYGGKLLQKIIRSIRRADKQALRRGLEPAPCKSRGYTD